MEIVYCVSVFLAYVVGVSERGYWLSFLSKSRALFAIFPGMFELSFFEGGGGGRRKNSCPFCLSCVGFEGLL